jgi:hypothetical protein
MYQIVVAKYGGNRQISSKSCNRSEVKLSLNLIKHQVCKAHENVNV